MRGENFRLFTYIQVWHREIYHLTCICICTPNLSFKFLTISEITTFKVGWNFFFLSSSTMGLKCLVSKRNHFLRVHLIRGSSISCFWLSWNYVCIIFTLTEPIKPIELLDFSHDDVLKFKYKGQSLTIKKAHQELWVWISKEWNHAIKPSLHVQNTKLKISKTSIFGGLLKLHKFNWFWTYFENIWAYTTFLGRFRHVQI